MTGIGVVETRTVIVTADFTHRALTIEFTPKASRHKRHLAPMIVPFDMITRIEERGGYFTRRYRIIITGYERECARPEPTNPAMFYVPTNQGEMRDLMRAVQSAVNTPPPPPQPVAPPPASVQVEDQPSEDTIETIELSDSARSTLAMWDALYEINKALGGASPLDAPVEPRMRYER